MGLAVLFKWFWLFGPMPLGFISVGKSLQTHYAKGRILFLLGLSTLSNHIQGLIPWINDDELLLFFSLVHYTEPEKEIRERNHSRFFRTDLSLLIKNSNIAYLDQQQH